MQFHTAHLSEAGGRKVNEDSWQYVVIDQKIGCWVVADGLGGHGGGEVASRLAVAKVLETFSEYPEFSIDALRFYIESAQQAILQAQAGDPRLSMMRTTIVVLISDFKDALWAHVGDSRLYHFQKETLVLITKDHSVPQALVNAGELAPTQIRFHEDRSRLLRALGSEEDRGPAFVSQKHPLHEDDAFLLCTDGFWEYVMENKMEEDLRATTDPEAWLRAMEVRLLQQVEGTHDNYTALALMGIPSRVPMVSPVYIEQAAPAKVPTQTRDAAVLKNASRQNKVLRGGALALITIGILIVVLGHLGAFDSDILARRGTDQSVAPDEQRDTSGSGIFAANEDDGVGAEGDSSSAPHDSSKDDGSSLQIKAEGPWPNSIDMEFVRIPPGTFMMGYSQGSDDEKPVHSVRISRPFYLGTYEVTQKQWLNVMGTPPPWQHQERVREGDDYPAVFVSWEDVQEFIRRLNAREGGTAYRLPTEAQWEYACRAGSTAKYSFGDDDDELDKYAWYKKNTLEAGEPFAHEVGRKAPNVWGLYDVQGNVGEWVEDWYGRTYYGQDAGGEVVDPTGPGTGNRRVFRGGNMLYPRPGASNRNHRKKNTRQYQIGFRLAWSSDKDPD